MPRITSEWMRAEVKVQGGISSYKGGSMPFTAFNTVSRVVNEEGCLEALPEEIGRLGRDGRRILIVGDPGIVAAGILDRAESVLSGAGLKSKVFF